MIIEEVAAAGGIEEVIKDAKCAIKYAKKMIKYGKKLCKFFKKYCKCCKKCCKKFCKKCCKCCKGGNGGTKSGAGAQGDHARKNYDVLNSI
ncbi:hypothetical protein Ciccas_007428 [Cichlidogyrus casuarinus]|uniref:Uncharacterized protein n=1 Tax=Cichlidogyrus casuarinus TaxID=1844966 RepID=A0ABD2Q2X8_9PLAT